MGREEDKKLKKGFPFFENKISSKAKFFFTQYEQK